MTRLVVYISSALVAQPVLAQGDNAYNAFDLASPTFANGTAIPAGSYRILVRSLRVTGNPTAEEDYDSWLSPIIGVLA
jgi:hypothetical protein